MLPFSAHYKNSPDFQATAQSVFANSDPSSRIIISIQSGRLMAKKQDGEYTDGLLVNTFESDSDKATYSVNGYHVVVDTRSASALAEIEAYCISNDGKNIEISYPDYLSLSDVAKLNFDFKIRYTGRELLLDDVSVVNYRSYVESLGDEKKLECEKNASELAEGKITKDEYNRAIYQLYFTNYYPEISNYESTSKVPLLRNYYYHQYIKAGESKYLFVFDDYLTGAFETKGGIKYSFYGFYNKVSEGVLLPDGIAQSEANRLVDDFIRKSFNSVLPLTLYAHAMNIFSFIPFIALMPMVVTLLAYSILKLKGVESITSLGAMFKVIGSYIWFSGVIAAVLSLIMSFFVQQNILMTLPLILFFIALAIRSMVFAVREGIAYEKKLEQQTSQTEA